MSFADEVIDEKLDLDPNIAKQAQTDDSYAQLEVGKAYYHATHIQDNCLEAFKWIEFSAKQGNMEAQFRLGDMFALGHGVDQNIATAHEWYTKAALQNYPKALIRIHNLYEEDKKIHCRGELNSEEKGQNEPAFKQKNNVRELNEYRLDWMQSKNILGNTGDYFSRLFKSLKESKDDDKDAQHKLGFLYQHGYGVRKIAKRAIEFYTKAAELGHIGAQYNLGLLYQENHDIKFNYRQAFKWYTKAAEGGSTPAQNRLAYFYEKGLVVEVDYSKALYWYTQAATNNHKGAMLNVARIYRKGLVDGKPDHAKAIKWYTIASKQGSSVAKNCLHQLSQRTDIAGINPIVDEALLENESSIKSRLCSKLRLDISNLNGSSNFNQLKELASHALVGDGNAMFELGSKYLEGEEFIQDRETGFIWIKKAAQSGLIKAQFYLARAYEEGITDVVKQDYYESSIWYYKAAKTKNSEAQNKIGLFYYQGHGLRKDPLEASKWFTWSADQGNSDGQYMLGILRQKGEGLREDSLESYEWFEKSAYQGNPYALYQLNKLNMKERTFSINDATKLKQEREQKIYMYSANHGSLDAQLLLAKTCEKEEAPAESFKYYLMAAKNGDMEAKYKIGQMYLDGRGVEQNFKEAFKWIYDSAEDKYKKAESLFATPIEISDTPIDHYRVLEMFKVAARSKQVSLEYNIGYIYEKGLGDPNSCNFIKPNPSKAISWYKLAEKNSDSRALYRLGKMYQKGQGVLRDDSIALRYFESAAKLSNIDSLNVLAFTYLGGIRVQEDSEKAFYLFWEAANFGCPNAQTVLALIYGTKERDHGEYLNKKIENMWEQAATNGNIMMQYKLGIYHQSHGKIDTAIKWFELAAHGGFAEACYNLGKIYEEEIEYVDYTKAIKMYEDATSKNHDMAMYRLALLYHHGVSMQRDYLKAFQLYTEAATHGNQEASKILDIKGTSTYNTNNEKSTKDHLKTSEEFKESLSMCEYVAQNGNKDLQYDIGYVYENNIDYLDYSKAHEWYSKASSNSHKEAAYRLGLLYKNGLGCSQNWLEAIQYFEKAMNLGSSEACFELGEIYYFGKGVDIDKSKATQYYFEAANQEDSNAQYTLGKLCENGDIVEKNLLKALTWYTKAYFQENEEAIEKLRYLGINKKGQEYHVAWANHQNGDENFQMGRYYYENPANKEENKDIAFIYLNKALNQKNFKALEYLNRAFYSGDEVKKYRKKAAELHNIFASDQTTEEIVNVGLLYYQGNDEINRDHSIAEIYFTKASNNGNAIAQQYLGDMYYHSDIKKNHDEAIRLHNLSANQRTGSKCFEIGQDYYKGTTLVLQNPEVALIYVTKAAEKDTEYQRYLADMYYYGEGVDEDQTEAFRLHELSASRLKSKENFDIGREYYEGSKDIKKNYSIGFIYLDEAVDQGSQEAERYLGDAYYYGDGVKKDDTEAYRLHKLSASRLKSEENLAIGREYYEGSENVKKNHFIGLIYLNKAVSQGLPEAERYLGDAYYYGNGVEKDDAKAKHLHELSANQLKSEENFNIGLEYYTGTGKVKRNCSIAYIYFTRANSKDTEATRYLGDMYFYGEGVEKDQKKAIELHKAAASSFERLKNFETGLQYVRDSKNIKKNNFKESNVKKNDLTGFLYINEAWNQQFPEAGRYLADMYQYGIGTEVDQIKAKELYKSSADQFGNRRNYETGRSYYEGSEGTQMNRSAGLVYLTKAADQGSSDAKRYLGDIYYYGDGVEKNQEKAMSFYESSAKQSSPEKNFTASQDYYKGLKNTNINSSIGLIYLTEAANREHPNARRYLGDTYYYSDDGEESKKKGIELYKSSASLFSSNESHKIGEEYYKGSRNVKKNLSIAVIYFTAAADKKNYRSQRYLGDMHLYGEGVEKDREKANEFYKSSANGCTLSDSVTFGLDYYRGSTHTKKNYDTAFIYFSKGSGTDVRATRYLGDMYYYGNGVKKDEKKAFELYNSSPSRPDRTEDLHIGQEHLQGSKNVNKNYSIAFIYLKKSFDQGNGLAAQHLGEMYLYGDGVEQNTRKAMEMFNASAKLLLKIQCFDIGLDYFNKSKNDKKILEIARVYLTRAAYGNFPEAEYLKELRD